MKLSRGMQIVVFWGATALAAHFYYQLLFKPVQREIRELHLDREGTENELSNLRISGADIEKLEAVYKERYEAFGKFEGELRKLEGTLPARHNMSKLLEQLTTSLTGVGGEFVSLEPSLERAEEGQVYDRLEIAVEFYGDFNQAIEYVKSLEAADTLLGISGIEMDAGSGTSARPLVKVLFSTFVGDGVRREDLEIKKIVASTAAAAPSETGTPFGLERKPYDKQLPGEHRLTMIIWQGGKRVALIDGKVMKESQLLGNHTIAQIEQDRVWFQTDGARYYLALET